VYTEKINKSIFNYSDYEIFFSLSDLNDQMLRIDKNEISMLENYSQQVFSEISSKLNFFITNGLMIKKSVIGTSASTTRLKVLAYLIKYIKFDLMIESGTQHGISALFIEKLVDSPDFLIYSLDIKNNVIPKGLNNVKYIILDSPVRESFKKKTSQFMDTKKQSIYFHDSDHSYENMAFEFNWAWNELNVNCLVSDDVSENGAFSNFVVQNNLIPYYCKFDSGSVVGFVLK
jgi:cephalosporin hydroxylase